MGNKKVKFTVGALVLIAGVLLGALLIMKISGLGSASGEVVGRATMDDGTNVTLIEIDVQGEHFIMNAPDGVSADTVYYDNADPTVYVDRGRLMRELLMFSLPMMILGITLMASNASAFSDIRSDEETQPE